MTQQKNKILIYGASGYTAKLFTKAAVDAHLDFVLAGRSKFETEKTYRIFSIDSSEDIDKHLSDIKLLINLAGPFSKTNRPLIEACIRTQTNYIDIAGEYPEFITAHQYHQQAQQAGIMLMPGAGFGVVPTDIAAHLAHQELPDATHLSIGFVTKGGASRGTLHTILKDINTPGVKIAGGKQIKALPASSKIMFAHAKNTHNLVYNPWRGDLFTALVSTGIQNIETYSNFPAPIVKMMQGKYAWLKQFLINTAIKWLPEGPNEKQLNKGSTLVLAKICNAKNHTKEVVIEGPEAYLFTVKTLVAITNQIMANNFVTGFQTPSIYGKELLNGISSIKIK